MVWDNVTLLHDSPPSVSMSGMVYDSYIRSEVLFGGGVFINGTSNTIFYNQTWIYSPQGAWYELNTPVAPPPRAGCVMQYIQPPYNEIVLFGGINETAAFDDTWILNMTTYTWTNATSSGLHPSKRGVAMSASLPGGDGFILYGGANATGGIPSLVTTSRYANDVWEYTPTTLWKNITYGQMPTKRGGATFEYTGSGSDYILFGGVTDNSNLPLLLSDTWLYNSTADTWAKENSSSGSNSGFAGCGVYDPQTFEDLYIGGYGYLGSGNTTWRWSPSTSVWSQAATSPGLKQPTIAGTECAFDPALNGTIVFGGTNAPQLGGNYFEDYDSTYLVRDVGLTISYHTPGTILSGSPFEIDARAVNDWGVTVSVNSTIALSDSTGTISPVSITLVDGYGVATVAVAKPLNPDTVSACLDGVCSSLSIPVLGVAESIAITPFPSFIQAGTVMNITLTVKNAAGGSAGWWNGTANLTTLPGKNITPVKIVYGLGTSAIKPTVVGNYSLLAFSGALAGAEENFTVTPGTLSNLSISLDSSTVKTGGFENGTITALDSYGNRVMLQKVNVSDILGDVTPTNFSMVGGVASISLKIGNTTGTDIVHALAETVSGVSESFYVAPVKVTPPVTTTTTSSSSNLSLIALVVIIVGAAVAIVLIVFRKIIFRKKNEPKPVAYLGLLPFQEDTKEKHHEEHRH
jgi:hypothetical protein